MATLRTGRSATILRVLMMFVALCLAWLQVSPAYASSASLARENARRDAWKAAHRPKLSLPFGLTQTPDPALRARIDAREAADKQATAKPAAARPAADVRPLTAGEMGRALGRGPLRNPYFDGAPMPWQRSFHDVNTSTGNLFKSFTDVQVAPARGAGLVLQRTYNSNDARVGPFGVGWTHAYDIRMQEAAQVTAEDGEPANLSDANMVPRTDFFGHKHSYHRDADGLYSPPPYLFDETSSDYGKFLANGPPQVLDDTEKGMDGTVKHYANVVTKADGTGGSERACDYIQDRYGNKTTLTYGLSFVQPDGSTRKLLTQVTDPVGRSLVFTWTNLGTSAQPAYRVTQVQGPLVSGQAISGVSYTVTYAYYTDPNESNAANDLYNLRSVTLDSGGMARTTSYTYTSFSSSYSDQNGNQQSDTENALLATVTDPLGHTITYHYAFITPPLWYKTYQQASPTRTIYVTEVDEPIANGSIQSWFLWLWNYEPQEGPYTGGGAGGPGTPGVPVVECGTSSMYGAHDPSELVITTHTASDAQLRTVATLNVNAYAEGGQWGYGCGFATEYDTANNVVDSEASSAYQLVQAGNVGAATTTDSGQMNVTFAS